LLAQRRPKETFSLLFHLTIYDFLSLVRTGLGGE
jgi:hypothetical protein